MSPDNLKNNKDLLYYDIPQYLKTNLSNDDLKILNDNCEFLIIGQPAYNLFYVNTNDKGVSEMLYKSYMVDESEVWSLNDLINFIKKVNIVKDKKMTTIYSITKKSNYYVIRYNYIDIENIYNIKDIKKRIRKEKIRLLLDNNSSFINDENKIQNIDNEYITTEEI